jgi:DNA-binding NarL/FixJ family response regulator
MARSESFVTLDRMLKQRSVATLAGLSAREAQVHALVAQGLSNRQIAQRLELSVHTVKRHVTRLMARLDVASRMEAAALFRGAAAAKPDASCGAPACALTPRERDVLAGIAAGAANSSIAADLSVSTDTVKRHATSIFAKLNVRSRFHAAAIAAACR